MIVGLLGLILFFYFPTKCNIWFLLLFLCWAFCVAFSVFTSDSFLKWYFKDHYADSLKKGKNYLENERYLEAVMKFSEALSYKNGSSALLGIAVSLDNLKQKDLAIQYYGSAYSSSLFNKETDERLLDMADFYVMALTKKDDPEYDRVALEICEKTLTIVKNKFPTTYLIQMQQALLFLKMKRVSEAQELFGAISTEAPQEELRCFASGFNSLVSAKSHESIVKYFDLYLIAEFSKWIN